MGDLVYIPTATGLLHHNCLHKRLRAVMGPPGSGKSVMNVMELLFLAMRQRPTSDGKRLSRWLVVRRTYSNLSTTTLKTLRDWLPAQYGDIKNTAPMTGEYIIPLADGTTVYMELVLISLETPKDLDKLNSLEVTGTWINEADEVDTSIITKCIERDGRYPSRKYFPHLRAEESHITWRGVLLDYNPPPEAHPLVGLLDSPSIPSYAVLFKQPAALLEQTDPETGKVKYILNPLAENVQAGADGGQKYFDDLEAYLAVGDMERIKTRLLCQYGGTYDGKPVWNNFDASVHVAEEPIKTKAGTLVLVAIDTSGIHPCAVFGQYYRGRWEIQRGLYGDEMGLEEFIEELVVPLLRTEYGDCEVLCVCDPADARDARTATSPTNLLITEYGLRAIQAPTNVFKLRREAVDSLFYRRDGLIIDPRLTTLIDACKGEYKYKKLRATTTDGTLQYAVTPEKDKYSHWADALQYFALHVLSKKVADADAQNIGHSIRDNIQRKRRVA